MGAGHTQPSCASAESGFREVVRRHEPLIPRVWVEGFRLAETEYGADFDGLQVRLP